MVGILASVIVGGVLGAAAFVLFNRFYPLYTSEVLFEVRPGLAESTEIGTAEALKDDEVERIARTQTELLMQRDVLLRAVQNPQVRSTNWLETWFMDTSTGQPLYAQAVDELEEDLATPVLRGTNLFAIRWSWHVPGDVPKVLDAIAASYMTKIKSLDDAQFSANEKLFDDQLRFVQMSLQDISDDIHSFIVSKGITTLDDPRFSQAAIEIQNLSTSLAQLGEELTSAQTQYQQTALKLEGTVEPTHDDILAAEQDPAVVQQINRLEVLKAEERSLREQYNEDTPQVRQIERQVRGVEAQLKDKQDEILHRNLNARLKALSAERERIERVIEQIEKEIESKDALLRDLAADTSRYQTMKTRQTNLEQQADDAQQLLNAIRLMKLRSDASRIRQVGSAELPRDPSFPRIEYVIPAGVFLCVGGFVGWIFLRELMEQRVRTVSDLAVVPGMTVVGAIADIEDDPAEPDEAELVILAEPGSVTAESVRQVTTTLIRMLGRGGHSTLLMAGGMPDSGTTTVLGNVACAIRAAGHSVCAIDGNFRRPYLGRMFGIEDAQFGLGDALDDVGRLDAAIHETESGVSIMPAGTESLRQVERLGEDRFSAVISSLRSRFDYVLVDVAPAVAASDATRLAGRCDASVLVIRADNEQRGLVARLVRELSESSAEFLGGVLNRPRQAVGGYFRRNYEVMASYGQNEDEDDDT